MANARSLGEGVIIKLLKKYAFIQDDKLGRIYFPLGAMLCDCDDLREKFTENESVIYTAQRQVPAQNGCNFIASSVSRKKDLTTADAIINEICEKYAYAEAPKLGKIFIPFSARNEFNKSWLGKGASVGSRCSLKVLRQPELNHCKFVAYAIYFGDAQEIADDFLNGLKDSQSQKQLLSRIERQPDKARSQFGIIVLYNGLDKDAYVYSAQTGLARVSLSDLKTHIRLGSCLQYDTCKYVTVEHPKCTWRAENVKLMKPFVTILKEKSSDQEKLSIETFAIVCRTSISNRAAWLWNDYVGRIYVNSHCFVSRMKAFTVVRVRAQYTGSFEDVPWSAFDVEVAGDNAEEQLKYAAQLLLTADNWKVNYVAEQATGTFIGFLEHEHHGSAFFAWTDMTEQDCPPREGSLCRVTFYKQFRDKRHNWRAVLVSLYDENNEPQCHHPRISMSGELRSPTPLLASSDASSVASIPEKANTPVPSEPPLDTADVGLVPWSCSDVSEGYHQDLDFLSKESITRKLSVQDSVVSNHVNVDKLSSSAADIWGMDPFHGVSRQALMSDEPQLHRERLMSDLFYSADEKVSKENTIPAGANMMSTSSASNTYQAAVGTASKGVQTDAFYEQKLLKDIFGNKDLVMKILQIYPHHATTIVNFDWRR